MHDPRPGGALWYRRRPANSQFLLGAWEAMSDVAHALLTVADSLYDSLYALLPHNRLYALLQLTGLHQAILNGLCAPDEAVTRTALRQHYPTGERMLAVAVSGAVSRNVAADVGTPPSGAEGARRSRRQMRPGV